MSEVDVQIERALHEPEGWWVRAVLSAFSGISDEYGFKVERVKMHFRGNYVWYRGSAYRIALGLDVESGALTGEFWLLEDLVSATHPRVLSIPRLLSKRAPLKDWEAPVGSKALTEGRVREVLKRWATGLRDFAPDVLTGELPRDANWGALW